MNQPSAADCHGGEASWRLSKARVLRGVMDVVSALVSGPGWAGLCGG